MIFRRQFDPNYQGSPGDINTGLSQTQPDMSLTVHELLDNHTRGFESNVKNYPLNYMETEIPRILDLTDIEKYRNQNEQTKNDLNETLGTILKAQQLKDALDLEKQQKDQETQSQDPVPDPKPI